MMETVEYIQDNRFSRGFQVHGPTHEEGIIARYPGGDPQPPCWTLAQWCVRRHPLNAETPRTELSGGGYQYETPSHTITVKPESSEYRLRLELRSSQEYGDHLRQDGEDWPHLLIDQGIPRDLPPLGRLRNLIYKAQLRLDYCLTPLDTAAFDPGLHGAQVVHFFTVSDPVSGNFLWFGIPFFDTRRPIYTGYIGIDGGKDDATGKLIYTCPQKPFFSRPAGCGEWIQLEADVLPMIKAGVDEANRRGLNFSAEIDNLLLTTNNLGWEMFSAYDGAFSIRELSLTGTIL